VQHPFRKPEAQLTVAKVRMLRVELVDARIVQLRCATGDHICASPGPWKQHSLAIWIVVNNLRLGTERVFYIENVTLIAFIENTAPGQDIPGNTWGCVEVI
jgi:hypothetical protein